ncbi:MAG: hypothetical protein JW395_3073 [Nitrospira sp.]|nr:hypothetical protein [Nitrospira sp.]
MLRELTQLRIEPHSSHSRRRDDYYVVNQSTIGKNTSCVDGLLGLTSTHLIGKEETPTVDATFSWIVPFDDLINPD